MTATDKNTAVERLRGDMNERIARLEVQMKIIMYLVAATFPSVFLPLLLKLIGN